MAESDPQQVIIDYLSLPEGEIVSQPDPNTPPVLKDGRWVRSGIIHKGGGMGAKASSVKFLKERGIPHRQVHAVTFEDEAGQRVDCVCFVTQNAQGLCHFEMSVGGSNGQVPEDTVDDGLVLFVTDEKVRVPIEVALYNRSGELVGQHSWGRVP